MKVHIKYRVISYVIGQIDGGFFSRWKIKCIESWDEALSEGSCLMLWFSGGSDWQIISSVQRFDVGEINCKKDKQ